MEKADFWSDIKAWDPRACFGLCVGLAALAAYVGWFGILAVFNVWRKGMLDPDQLLIVFGGLVCQSSLFWALRVPPLVGGLILGIVLGVPATLAILSGATSGDYLHATLFVVTPIVLCLGNGWIVGRLFRLCALPQRRGG